MTFIQTIHSKLYLNLPQRSNRNAMLTASLQVWVSGAKGIIIIISRSISCSRTALVHGAYLLYLPSQIQSGSPPVASQQS